jgi:hypothetical protein
MIFLLSKEADEQTEKRQDETRLNRVCHDMLLLWPSTFVSVT